MVLLLPVFSNRKGRKSEDGSRKQ